LVLQKNYFPNSNTFAKSVPVVFFYNPLKIKGNLKIDHYFLSFKLPIFLTVAYFYVQSSKNRSDFFSLV